jgi:energy-coupling factor transport system permease protein
MAIGAVFVAQEPETLLAECILLLVALPLLGIGRAWLHSLRFLLPMVGLVFVIGFISFDILTTLVLSIRLINLLNVCFIFFRSVSPEEMGNGLNKIGIPYVFTFILTTAMRYVPLIGLKINHIFDAQRSRGIDLRPKLRNMTNFMALLMPLLAQSFILSDELAMAMESRGFARKRRSSRRQYRLNLLDYLLMVLSLALLVLFTWWERG